MAEDKNSFIAYCDWGDIFDELEDAEAGKLVKHLFDYVRDKNPEPRDKLTKMMFIQIQQSLKRDLAKYSKYIDKQKVNGAKGGRPKNPTLLKKTQPFSEKPKKADSDSVSVSVNDNVNVNDIKKEAPNTGVVFPFDSEKFKKQWNLWKDYKLKEFRFKYKTPQSEQAALIKLAELANKNEDQAILIINESFANGWKGFFKTQNNGSEQKQSVKPTDDELANALREAGFNNG